MCGPGHHLSHGADHQEHPEAQARPTAVATDDRPCPRCGAPVREDFVFCPRCGEELLTACPACHRAVEAKWIHCAYCGAELAKA